ncbi:conserved oligomeric Golgi complex subunit 2 [Anabrus simplex]|uniref:conserved oligomeric Golgi complex subunit 2 n=1 Tax=Anabrus simplex TaxID=316456 RepID=UPI0035A32E68
MSKDSDTYTLPVGPSDLCFDKNEFIKQSFSVDQFLQDHRKRADLETMRDDLGVYLKVLRSAMIELINKDYQDFVNLSSNLIGLDKGIHGIQVPLGQLREEVLQVRSTLEEAMTDVSAKLEERRQLRVRKRSLQSIATVRNLLQKLNALLQTESEELLEPELVERAASQYNQLQFSISKCEEHLNAGYKQQAEKICSRLTSSLHEMFLKSVQEHNTKDMSRCLRIYVMLDEISAVETLFRKKVVAKVMQGVISETALNSDPRGLQGVYAGVLGFVENTMKELLELTTESTNQSANLPTVKGFDFLVNSFWPEVEERLEKHVPSIYSPGNPDLFYQRYCDTMDFLSRLEKYCGTRTKVKKFHAHPQYTAFLQHWNLPIYFQIRFQEIAGSLESVLSDVSSATMMDTSSELQLLATATVWDCLLRCWSEGVFIYHLAHRFLKLNLQILARFYTWILEVLQERWPSGDGSNTSPSKTQFLVCLYLDIQKLTARLPDLEQRALTKMTDLSPQTTKLVQSSLMESKNQLLSRLSTVSQFILSEVSSEGLTQLRQVSDIPRLFRRTNREVPTKPCPYVALVLAVPIAFYNQQKPIVDKELLEQWLTLIFSAITNQFYSAVADVLTSVQKTEESLRRLKKIRDRSASASPGENKGVGDDDKIRQQLALDVHSYCQGILDVGIRKENVEKLEELVTLVETARSSSK